MADAWSTSSNTLSASMIIPVKRVLNGGKVYLINKLPARAALQFMIEATSRSMTGYSIPTIIGPLEEDEKSH